MEWRKVYQKKTLKLTLNTEGISGLQSNDYFPRWNITTFFEIHENQLNGNYKMYQKPT